MRNLARRMIALRNPLLLACAIATIFAYPIAQESGYNRSVRSFFDPDDPQVDLYETSEKRFKGDSVALVVYTDPELLGSERISEDRAETRKERTDAKTVRTTVGMARLDDFAAKLEKVKGVEAVTSLADLRRPSAPHIARSILQWSASGTGHEALSQEIRDDPVFRDQFIGADGETTGVALVLDSKLVAEGETSRLVAEIRELCDEYELEAHVVGVPILFNDFFDKIRDDSWTLSVVSTSMMVLVIFLLFQNVRWVAIPLGIVYVTQTWTQAFTVACGLEPGFASAMSTALVCVVGVATTIHVAMRFREELQDDGDVHDAFERSFARTFPAVFWTCATTAVGFGVLAISSVAPIRDFGIVMATASVFVGLAALSIVPAFVLFGVGESAPGTVVGEGLLGVGLGEIESLANRYSWATLAAAALTIAAGVAGLTRLEVETDFSRNFSKSFFPWSQEAPVLSGYRFVEERLGGAGLFGVSFDAPEEMTEEFLDRVRDFENAVREIDGVSKVLGLPDFLDFAEAGTARLPETLRRLLTLKSKLRTLAEEMPDEVAQTWNPTVDQTRVIVRIRESQAADRKLEIIESIEADAQKRFGDSARANGLYVLLTRIMDSLMADQWRMFALSSVAMLAMLALAFGSPRVAIAAFIPNIVPIVTVVGAMGWLDMRVNAATAMIHSISMGLAVDFSIHYLYRYRFERSRGKGFYEALAATQTSTGKAMVFASVALITGFAVLTLSNFLPTRQYGLLVALAMAGGLTGNLVLLPVLLRYLSPDAPPFGEKRHVG